MAKITNIKYQIDLLSGGKFQSLCDSYLSKKGYENIVTLGMKSGTEKTTKGIPDTYFTTRDGKYVLVMYTAQKTGNLFKKISEDIEDALNKDKTGLDSGDVVEIVYCHTSSNIKAGEDKQLKEMCGEKGVLLSIFGIDTIAQDLYDYYHRLAKDFLGVAISTEQIMEVEDFVLNHSSNSMSVPIDTQFLFREKEVSDIIEKISNNNIVVISGASGVGKTRLALECVKLFEKSHDMKTYCIKNNGLSIYEDLTDYLSKPDKYLILIDDANELTSLNLIFNYLNKPGYDIKIICTVRDYARKFLINTIVEFENPTIIEISTFSDSEISEMIEKNCKIKNKVYQDKIIRIAEGNARIAMLSAKIALEKGSLKSIENVSLLYEHYYAKFLNETQIFKKDNKLLITVGTVAFLGTLHLDRLEVISPILDFYEIKEEEFKKYVYELHGLEILDVYNDKAVKFSEQTLANYFLKLIFIDKNLINFVFLIENFFPQYKKQIISSINMLGSIFKSEEVNTVVSNSVMHIWNKWKKESNPYFEGFIEAFYAVNLTEALILLKQKIESEKTVFFEISKMDFNEIEKNKTVDNTILKIIGGFSETTQLEEALDLYFMYFNKRPDMFVEFYHTANSCFNITKDSHRYDYNDQVLFFKKLNEYSDNWKNSAIKELFLSLAGNFLKVVHNPIEGARGDSLVMYTLPIIETTGSKEYRKIIWKNLEHLFAIEKYHIRVKDIIKDYASGNRNEVDNNIENFDLNHILAIMTKFDSNSVNDCILVHNIMKKFSDVKLTKLSGLEVFLKSDKLSIYNKIMGEKFNHSGTWQERRKNRKDEISKYVRYLSFEDIKKIVDISVEIDIELKGNWSELTEGLEDVFEGLYERQEVYIQMAKYYLECNTPVNIYPNLIIQKLFEYMSCDKVFSLITKENYDYKNSWVFSFYSNLPEKEIESRHTQEWYRYLEEEFTIKWSPHRRLDFLDKFEKYDSKIFKKSYEIIYEQAQENSFLVNIYLGPLFSGVDPKVNDIVEKFGGDSKLLQDLYLISLEKCESVDYKGKFLLAIVQQEFNFIYDYLLLLLHNKVRRKDLEEGKLEVLWHLEDYIRKIDLVVDFIYRNQVKSYILIPQEELQSLLKFEDDDIHFEKKEEWIRHYIHNYSTEIEKMEFLFRVISAHNAEQRRKYLFYFSRINNDVSHFNQIALSFSDWFWSERKIQVIQSRISFFESLLPDYSGLNYLEHKQLIFKEIERLKNSIVDVEVDEILLGHSF